jgi:hypothetical protein
MSAAGATARAAATAAQRQFGFYDEAHVTDVDFNAANTFKKGFFEAEGETVDFKGLVVFSRLIQSQCETRAASATGGKIDTDAGLGLIGEESLKFCTCGIRKIDHRTLHVVLMFKP